MKFMMKVALLVLWTGAAMAQVTFVDDVQGFLDEANAACGASTGQFEDFESPPWDTVRFESFDEAVVVTANGIDWLSNVPGDTVTTSLASAQFGLYGFFSTMHGDEGPPQIFDGFRVETDGMCAFAIWVRTTTLPGEVGFILNDTGATGGLFTIADFGWHHIGIVEPGGFTSLEVVQTNGLPNEGDNYFFDNASTYVPEPSMAMGLMFGVLAIVAKGKGRI